MPRITPLDPGGLPADLAGVMEAGRQIMGFAPNDALTMARKPGLLRAMLAVVQSVYEPGAVDIGFKKLIGLVASNATGCQYCVAHTAHSAYRAGVQDARLDAVWEFEQSGLFTPAERAALRFAIDASHTPNAVTDESFRELKLYWDEGQIIELLAVVCMFGFLNRWNATLATELESTPLGFAGRSLPTGRWEPGIHAAEPEAPTP
jgi:uncharacterized peroxidase-related enzyme